MAIGEVGGRQAFAVLSQLRNIDSRRLIEMKGHVAAELLALLKKVASLMNLGEPSLFILQGGSAF
jgi:hypothetical protein